MKSYINLIIYFTAVLSQTISTNDTCDFDCRFVNLVNTPENKKKVLNCSSNKGDAEQASCVYTAIGFKQKNVDIIAKITQAVGEYCSTSIGSDIEKCLASNYNVTNYDVDKATICTNQCTQTTAEELYECAYSCNKVLYDKVTAGTNNTNTNSTTQARSSKTTTDKTLPTQSATTRSNSGNFGTKYNLTFSFVLFTLISLLLL